MGHIVFISNYWRKKLYKELRQRLGEVFKRLAEQKESRGGRGTCNPTTFTFSSRFRPSTR
jgi:putative transposase